MQKPLKGYWVSHCKPAIFDYLMNISSKINTILYFSFSDMTAHITNPSLWVYPNGWVLTFREGYWAPIEKLGRVQQVYPNGWTLTFKEGYWTPIAWLGRVHLPKKHFNIGEKVKPTETPISRSSSREALSNSFYLTREKMKLPFFRPDHQISPQACIMNEQLGASSKSVLSGN